MEMLGVILARGGSVGLKDKHLRLLLGKPVIQYTVDAALASRRLTRIVVSSDSPAILDLAKASGLDVIQRPADLATSTSSVQDVMLHAMQTLENQGNFTTRGLVVLYGNVAVRPPAVIDRAIEHLDSTGCDSVRSFCPVGKWHPAWMNRLDGDRVHALQPGSIHRRQDLEPLYLHDGAVVAVSRHSMQRGITSPHDPHAFFGEDRRGILVEADQTVEIDQLRDLYWAEAVLRARQEQAHP